jgi:putative Holliday junction resolvase
MSDEHSSVLALDVGTKRIGLALSSLEARLPKPYMTLERDGNFMDKIKQIIKDENVDRLVVGLPRGLDGQSTAQTTSTESFADELASSLNLQIHFQDEAVTSRQAEAELEARKKPYEPGDIDALAATYILEDYLAGNPDYKRL